MEMFGITAKFINHPSLMPDLYKTSMMTDIQLWINKQYQQSQLGMLPWVIHYQHLTITICDHVTETLYM